MSNDSNALGLVLIFFCIVIYFIPALNASRREHSNSVAIFLLNLFLGWTLIGWVAALVWSASAISPAPTESLHTEEAAPVEQDKYQKLEILASLKERGMITDEEFQKEKAELLGG